MALRLLILGNLLGLATAVNWQFWKKAEPQDATHQYSDKCPESYRSQCFSQGNDCAQKCGSSYAKEALDKVRQATKGEGVSKTALAIGLAVSMLAVSCFVANRFLKLMLYFLFSVSFFCAAIVTTKPLKNWVLSMLLK